MHQCWIIRWRSTMAGLLACTLLFTACDVWQPFEVTSSDSDPGLVVLYPGASSIPAELTAWAAGLRLAGVNRAIQIVAWGTPASNLANAVSWEENHAFAAREAERLAAYMDEHSSCPVTLIGYSAGAAIAVWVTEATSADHPVDQVLMMGADLSPEYDLSSMLDHTRHGAVHYWSPKDGTLALLTTLVGTMDRKFAPPAGKFGFESTDSRLKQIEWQPEMAAYGDFGSHTDYLFNPFWIRDFLATWIIGFERTP